MRFLSAQLSAYLDGDLWLRNAAHANAMAQALGAGLSACPGVRLLQPVQGNEVFAAMPEAMIAALEAQGAHFYRWIDIAGIDLPVIRLVTSFITDPSEIDAFLTRARTLEKLAA